MALIRNMVFLTFEENDTFNDKQMIRSTFEKQGFKLIAETKIEQTGIVKEWVMLAPVQYGKLNAENVIPSKKIYEFDPAGGTVKR